MISWAVDQLPDEKVSELGETVTSPVSAETRFKMTSAIGSLLRVMLRLSVAPDSVTEVELFVS